MTGHHSSFCLDKRNPLNNTSSMPCGVVAIPVVKLSTKAMERNGISVSMAMEMATSTRRFQRSLTHTHARVIYARQLHESREWRRRFTEDTCFFCPRNSLSSWTQTIYVNRAFGALVRCLPSIIVWSDRGRRCWQHMHLNYGIS